MNSETFSFGWGRERSGGYLAFVFKVLLIASFHDLFQVKYPFVRRCQIINLNCGAHRRAIGARDILETDEIDSRLTGRNCRENRSRRKVAEEFSTKREFGGSRAENSGEPAYSHSSSQEMQISGLVNSRQYL